VAGAPSPGVTAKGWTPEWVPLGANSQKSWKCESVQMGANFEKSRECENATGCEGVRRKCFEPKCEWLFIPLFVYFPSLWICFQAADRSCSVITHGIHALGSLRFVVIAGLRHEEFGPPLHPQVLSTLTAPEAACKAVRPLPPDPGDPSVPRAGSLGAFQRLGGGQAFA